MNPRTIACWFPFTTHYTLWIIEGVSAYVSRHPHLRLQLPGQVPFRPLSSIQEFQGDGLIGFFSSPEEVASLQQQGVVVANVSSATNRIRPWIHVDNFRVGALAADGLCSQGFRRFLYVDFLDMIREAVPEEAETHFSQERFSGFQGRLRERGLDAERWRLRLRSFRQADKWSAAIGRMARQLRQRPRPLGIYCVNDNAAGLVLLACQQAGIPVPEEIAVIGTDNESLICNGLEPRLSSIEHGPERLGWTAAQLLDDIFAGRASPDTEIRLDPVELVERESSSSRQVDDPLVARALALIRQGLQDNALVASLPERLGISRRALERRFKEATSLSPGQEQIRLRLQKVRRELLATRRSIKAIALDNGFCGAEHLQAMFRRRYQISPDAWRKLNQPVPDARRQILHPPDPRLNA